MAHPRTRVALISSVSFLASLGMTGTLVSSVRREADPLQAASGQVLQHVDLSVR
ncbi:MAG: hypothetical protein M3R29_04425 [Verrucomicrobiota bacterium]|nr:hypothetical protein [Verrucomicrobiota bacterium]